MQKLKVVGLVLLGAVCLLCIIVGPTISVNSPEAEVQAVDADADPFAFGTVPGSMTLSVETPMEENLEAKPVNAKAEAQLNEMGLSFSNSISFQVK